MRNKLLLILLFLPFVSLSEEPCSNDELIRHRKDRQTKLTEMRNLKIEAMEAEEDDREEDREENPLDKVRELLDECIDFETQMNDCRVDIANQGEGEPISVDLSKQCQNTYDEIKDELETREERLIKEEERKTEQDQAEREAIEKKQQLLQERCNDAYNEAKRERDQIEKNVQRLQQELDKVEDAILKANSAIATSEDRFRQSLLNKKQQYRKETDRKETEIRERKFEKKEKERQAIKDIRKLEQIKIELVHALGQAGEVIRNICSDRFQKYVDTSRDCHNLALQNTKKERDNFFTKIESGEYQAASLSTLFSFDRKNTIKRWRNRIQELHQECYINRVGENLPTKGQKLKVQVSCDVATLEKRKEDCEKIQDNSLLCPQSPMAIGIELETLNKLKSQKKLLETTNRRLKDAEENLTLGNEEIIAQKSEIEKRIKQAERQFEKLKEKRDEEIQFENNKLTKARHDNRNKILNLEKKKIRLLSQDPTRHFEETIWTAKSACCTQLPTTTTASSEHQEFQTVLAGLQQFSQSECQYLKAYLNEASRWQFISVQNLDHLNLDHLTLDRLKETSEKIPKRRDSRGI